MHAHKQLRTRDVTNLTALLCCVSQPSVEETRGAAFGFDANGSAACSLFGMASGLKATRAAALASASSQTQSFRAQLKIVQRVLTKEKP